MINGRYYSATFTTGSVAGYDLMTAVRANLSGKGAGEIAAKKMTLISSGCVSVDINNLGVYSGLWQNPDGNYVLSLDAGDVNVQSLKIRETSASGIFMAIVF